MHEVGRRLRLFSPVAALVVAQQLFWPVALGVVVEGALVGALTALIALGIVLVHRANRIVNFAQGDLGAAPAVLAVLLIVGNGFNWWAGMAIAVVAGLVLGAVVEVLVVRRFFRAPRLVLSVATIGLAQVLAGAGLLLPSAFELKRRVQSYAAPLHVSFTVRPIRFDGNDVIAMIAVPIVLAGLAVFLRVTRLGIAVRATADSADRASTLGIPVHRVHTAVWAVAAGLSSFAVFLRAGVIGLPIGSVLGPGILLRALAAAVLGGMEDLGLVVAGAVALGVVEQAVVVHTGQAAYVDPVLFAVILGALLLVRRRTPGRVDTTPAVSWAGEEVRPVARAVARLPEVRVARVAIGVVVVTVTVAVPWLVSQSRLNLVSAMVIFAIVALSLVVLTGWAGQVSLGQVAFVGIGAAVAGALTSKLGWDLVLAVVAAGAAGAVVAVLVGLPALRVRGLLLAVTTLAFALATSSYLLNRRYFGWLPGTRVERNPIMGVFGVRSETRFYYVALAGLVFALLAVRGVRRSRTGRVLIALRENERATQSFGVHAARTTLVAFALSGFLAGYAGALFVHHQEGLGQAAYAPAESLKAFTMVVIGGLGSVPGALLGAGYVRGVDWFLPDRWRFVATGGGLLAVLLVFPGGLGAALFRGRDALLALAARRRGLHEPLPAAEAAAPVATSVPESQEAGDDDGVLVVRGLDVRYGPVQVLFGVDLAVRAGEIVTLLGTNGAGKSTLLSAVAGVARGSAGSIRIDGEDVRRLAPDRIARRGVVSAPGGRGVFPSLTVGENLRMAAWLTPGRRGRAAAVAEVADRFPVLGARLADPAATLSGGQQQLLTLAMALTRAPRLLLVDELSLGLSPALVGDLVDALHELRDRGAAIVVVEQSVDVALRVSERTWFVDKGELRFSGPTAELLRRPELLRSVFLGRDRPPAAPPARPRASPVAADAASGPPALELDRVSKRFGGVVAVDGVSLAVAAGDVVGLIGPNGAGKTTLFDVACGFLAADAGTIRLAGRDVARLPAPARAGRGLGRSFQDGRLFPALTVDETIAVALERHVPVRDPLAAALHLPAVTASEARVRARVDELVELSGLGPFRDRFVRELSTGTRRVAELACMLAHRPSVLLLDEPSAGLAQREAEALVPVLRQVREETGAALVIIEHDVPLVTEVADRLVALDRGRVVADGVPAEVVRDPGVVASYFGGRDGPG